MQIKHNEWTWMYRYAALRGKRQQNDVVNKESQLAFGLVRFAESILAMKWL